MRQNVKALIILSKWRDCSPAIFHIEKTARALGAASFFSEEYMQTICILSNIAIDKSNHKEAKELSIVFGTESMRISNEVRGLIDMLDKNVQYNKDDLKKLSKEAQSIFTAIAISTLSVAQEEGFDIDSTFIACDDILSTFSKTIKPIDQAWNVYSHKYLAKSRGGKK